MQATQNVSIGPGTITGYIGTVALAVAAVTEGIDTSHGIKAAALSAAVLVLTNLGRFAQAHAHIKAGAAGAPVAEAPELPTLAEEEAAPPVVPDSAVESEPAAPRPA